MINRVGQLKKTKEFTRIKLREIKYAE